MSIERFLLKLNAHDVVRADEAQVLIDALREQRTHAARKVIIRVGQEVDYSTLLLDGLMCRYKDLRDGGRQISALHIPGDFVDLHSFSLKRLDHNIMTMTACEVAIMQHETLKQITEHYPHLTRLLWFLTNVDAALHREWELSLGRRDALARTAHLLCELQARLQVVGLADESGFDLKLTQTELAECLGLTSVHINRTLRRLREDRLVEFRSGKVEIADRKGLERAAEFKPNYLYLNRRDR
jgi:CRP-like cAMP-binding protein